MSLAAAPPQSARLSSRCLASLVALTPFEMPAPPRTALTPLSPPPIV
jgi:hypothetical protein